MMLMCLLVMLVMKKLFIIRAVLKLDALTAILRILK